MRTNQLQRAIDSLKAERAVLDAAIAKLLEQQGQAKPKARKAKPAPQEDVDDADGRRR